MDIVDQSTRSRMMRSVRQRDTLPEVRLRRALHKLGFRYRLGRRDLPGSPDIVFPRFKAVVFVHGCFWHGHDCRFATVPKTRTDFWIAKFEANRRRDARVVRELEAAGWRVLTLWECALKSDQAAHASADRVADWLCRSLSYRAVDQEDGHPSHAAYVLP